jgi:hypothetical protein
MLNSTTFVRRGAVFADVLNTPVPELAMGEHVGLREHLFDCRPLSDKG